MAETMAPNLNAPVLWGPDGKPLSTEGAMVAPAALNVAQILQLPGRLYSFRWDEAMKQDPFNALAMRLDAYYLSLLQERWAPTINLEWQVEVDNEDDPVQAMVKDTLNRMWLATPDKPNLIGWLLQAEWFGRSAQQGVWSEQPSTKLKGWTFHEPVHGDSVQFSWDGTPAVLVSWQTAQKYLAIDPQAVISASDRGAYAIRLYKPEYRRRFIIHKYLREAVDYFDGEKAGAVHGVGLRSQVYWSGWMRTEVMSWMISFMQSTGMMDMIILNYADGNDPALKAQQANAKLLSGKIVLLVPRDPSEKFQPVEQLQMNAQGVEVLRGLVEGYYDRHIQMLITGQSMSAGGGGSGGLEGDGRAELAKDTKYQLCKTSALRIAETLTTDYLMPAKDYNFPGEMYDFPVRLKPVLKDPDDGKKFECGTTMIQSGVEIVESEYRKAGGYRDPKPGEKTVGKKEEQQASGNPNQPAGQSADSSLVSDFYERIGRLEQLILYHAASPPWPGAVFDEQRHRWVSGKQKPESGRATKTQSVDEQHLDSGRIDDPAGLQQRSRGFAQRIKSAGGKAVEIAQALGRKAQEIAFNATWATYSMKVYAEDILDTSEDYSKIINAKGIGSWIEQHIGIGGNIGAVVASHILAYGFCKLKQAIAAKKDNEKTETLERDEWMDLYDSGVMDKAEAVTELLKALYGAIGVPEELLPDVETVQEWIAHREGEAVARPETHEVDLSIYRLISPPFPGGVFDERIHRWVKPNKNNDEASTPSKAEASTPSKAEAGRATKDEPKKPRTPPPPLPERFKKSLTGRNLIDASVQRWAEGTNEPAVAKEVGGHALPDNEPMDVVVRNESGQPRHGLELKTMVANSHGQIHMNTDAKRRKKAWRRKNKVPVHTIVIDDRDVYNAQGQGQHDLTKRKVYYRRGFGSFKVQGMYEVPGGIAGIKDLLDLPTKKLPPGAWKPAKPVEIHKHGTLGTVTSPAMVPSFTPDAEAVATARKWTESARSADISPDQRKVYTQHMSNVLTVMTPGCRKAALESLEKGSVKFHPDFASIKAAGEKITGKKDKGLTAGFVAYSAGSDQAHLHVDGGSENLKPGSPGANSLTTMHVYAHEMGHAVDVGNRYSSTGTWKAIWMAEINTKGSQPLGAYSTTNPAEGFAEFHRALALGNRDKVKQKFPRACAYFEKQGLL